MPKTYYALTPFALGASTFSLSSKDQVLGGYVELESDLDDKKEGETVTALINDTMSKYRVARIKEMIDALLDALVEKFPNRHITVQIATSKVVYIPEKGEAEGKE